MQFLVIRFYGPFLPARHPRARPPQGGGRRREVTDCPEEWTANVASANGPNNLVPLIEVFFS